MAQSINSMGNWGTNGNMKECRLAQRTSTFINQSSNQYSEIQDIDIVDINPKCGWMNSYLSSDTLL